MKKRVVVTLMICVPLCARDPFQFVNHKQTSDPAAVVSHGELASQDNESPWQVTTTYDNTMMMQHADGTLRKISVQKKSLQP